MIAVYIFYGSLIGMLGMLTVKMYEAKRRRRSLVYRIFVNFDEITHGMLAKIMGNLRAKKDSFEDFMKVDFKKLLYLLAVKAVAHIRESYDKIRESSRGVQKLKENPKVSAFLRDIEEAKKEINKKNEEEKAEESFLRDKLPE